MQEVQVRSYWSIYDDKGIELIGKKAIDRGRQRDRGHHPSEQHILQ